MADVPARLAAALAARYRLESELGQGGMATVYLAYDLRHERRVAVKVLRPELAAALGADRFLNEIRIAANLTHPHILPLHDSGEIEGFLFYVMPFVEGESLRTRLAREGELPVHEAARILRDVADALAYAHQQGVVHRDIKPDNVLLSGRHALVMDFGVAKAVSEATGRQKLTTAGMALGTPAYMSPEQAVADPHMDHRADIYALGVMAYEMLAGQPPFTGPSAQAILAAQVTEAARPITLIRQAVPPQLAQLVMQCLEKRPADRPAHADALLPALEGLTTTSGGITPTGTMPVAAARARGRHRVAIIAGGLVLLFLAGGYGVTRLLRGPGGSAQSIAVLPFETVGGADSNQVFTDGIQDEILTDLTHIATLQVTSRASVREYRNTTKGVKQIGTELGVRTLLSGQVQRAGTRVHVNVQLIDASRDRQLWAESYDRELTAGDVFAIQGDIARNVATALAAQFTATEAASLGSAPTSNLEALDWYHRGRDMFDQRGGKLQDTSSVRAFEQAVALDSNFAEAWAGLAEAHSWEVRQGSTTDTLPARRALDRALALKPESPDVRLARAFYAYYARGDYSSALAEFRAVGAIRPGDPDAMGGVGYILRRQGHFAQALEAEQRVSVLDPRSSGRLVDLGDTYQMLRRSEEASGYYQRARVLSPGNEGAYGYSVWTALWGLGDTAATRQLLDAPPPGLDPSLSGVGLAAYLRLTRRFDASDSAIARIQPRQLTAILTRQSLVLLNSLASRRPDRTAVVADSLRQSANALIQAWSSGDVFGNLADAYSALGLAEAALGHAREAVAAGERAVALNPVSRDAVEGPRSVDALIAIHVVLGHRAEALRLLREEASRPPSSTALVPITPVALRMDPLFDSLRDDPEFQRLLKDDAAWVVER